MRLHGRVVCFPNRTNLSPQWVTILVWSSFWELSTSYPWPNGASATCHLLQIAYNTSTLTSSCHSIEEKVPGINVMLPCLRQGYSQLWSLQDRMPAAVQNSVTNGWSICCCKAFWMRFGARDVLICVTIVLGRWILEQFSKIAIYIWVWERLEVTLPCHFRTENIRGAAQWSIQCQ